MKPQKIRTPRRVPKRVVSGQTRLRRHTVKPRIIMREIDSKIRQRNFVLLDRLSDRVNDKWAGKIDYLEKTSTASDYKNAGVYRLIKRDLDKFVINETVVKVHPPHLGGPTELSETIACAESVLGPFQKKNVCLIGGNIGEAIGLMRLKNNVTSVNADEGHATLMKDVLHIPSIKGFAENKLPKIKRRFSTAFSRSVISPKREFARKLILECAKKCSEQIHVIGTDALPLEVFLLNGWKTYVFDIDPKRSSSGRIIVMKKSGV